MFIKTDQEADFLLKHLPIYSKIVKSWRDLNL